MSFKTLINRILRLTKNTLSAIVVVLILVGCYDDKNTSVKVMTWNIWHGGLHGTKANDFEKDTVNTENVLKVLLEENPDIVFMQETYCCGMTIAKEAGYKYSYRASSNLSIHSKYPVIDTLDIFNPFNAQAAILDINGLHVLCVNIWLHYLPNYFQDIKSLSPDSLIQGEGTTRLKEISAILKSVDSLSKIYIMPIIMGGDFNSGSHLDWLESTKVAHYNKVVEWPVSKMMIEDDFTDSFREANADPNSTLQGTWGFLNDDIISDRIDFIYYRSENMQTIKSEIVMKDPLGGFFNSDHRAVSSIFKFKY